MGRSPKIILSSQDLDRIETLLDSLPPNVLAGQGALMAELNRADVVEPPDIPPTVVTMNSTVRFTIESTGEEFCLTLVYPKDMDGRTDRISVLAPIGSALLGLSVSDHIEWPTPGGGMIRVRIMEVLYQPERDGEFHR
jgi:regulator of nucleoside diphosphate kinase